MSYFPWFYPKRASHIADMMTEEERNQSLKIVRSGKMEYLSLLAESDLSGEDIKFLADNIEKDNKTICYYDAKTTSRGLDNADSIPFFLRKSQWLFLNVIAEDTPYYIARVFISDNNRVRYIRIISHGNKKDK